MYAVPSTESNRALFRNDMNTGQDSFYGIDEYNSQVIFSGQSEDLHVYGHLKAVEGIAESRF